MYYGGPVFTEDGLEAYWTTMGGQIQICREIDGQWTTPADVSFAALLTESKFPNLSPDGQRMFFNSSSYPGPELEQKENIWMVERADEGWGSPSPLPSSINSRFVHWQVSVADNGNLYHNTQDTDGGNICVSRYSEGEYQQTQSLPAEISSPAFEITPFVAPDESYIIFARFHPPAQPYPDLYISFRNADDSWTTAVSMDELNNPEVDEICPNVTRDGRYLFFLSGITGPYWVSAEVIELYRPSSCTGTTGNVDCDPDELVDIGDLTRLIDYLYIPPNAALECVGEGNIDGDPDGIIDVGDLTRLIAYLYIPPNPPPEECS
jgi:hypothetical protein